MIAYGNKKVLRSAVFIFVSWNNHKMKNGKINVNVWILWIWKLWAVFKNYIFLLVVLRNLFQQCSFSKNWISVHFYPHITGLLLLFHLGQTALSNSPHDSDCQRTKVSWSHSFLNQLHGNMGADGSKCCLNEGKYEVILGHKPCTACKMFLFLYTVFIWTY